MKQQLQYKIFNNVDDLNKWLLNFTNNPLDKDDKTYSYMQYGKLYILGQIQFLSQANVTGNDSEISGSASVYPVASYIVGDLNE